MDTKKKRLLELVEDLNFPIPPEEAKECVEKLNEGDLNTLIKTYEAILNFREDLEDTVREENPEKYEEIMDKYHRDMEEAWIKYAKDSQKEAEGEDQRLDLAEAKAEKSIEEAVEEFEKGLEDVTDVSNVLASKIRTVIGGNN